MRKTMLAITWSATAAVIGIAGIAAPAAYADDSATASPTPTPVSSSTAAPACGAGLPVWVQGRPKLLHAGGAAGDYLWHGSDGWHLRVTHHTRSKKVFTGVIVASEPITFARVKDETRDAVKLSDDKKKLVFRFVNYGGLDGVDFTDACAMHTHFAFAISGHRATRNQIYVGAHSARPGRVPFTINRQSRPTAA
jgi:hypothetical protein